MVELKVEVRGLEAAYAQKPGIAESAEAQGQNLEASDIDGLICKFAT